MIKIIIAYFLSVLLLFSDEEYGHMGGEHFCGFGGGIMWVIWLVIVVAVIYSIYRSRAENKIEERESPLEILKKRLARGEISQQEYEQLKKKLGL